MNTLKNKTPKGLRTWAEVDTKALKHNYAIFRRLIAPDCKLMAVVKSNAYGHGFIEYSQMLERYGVDYLGVDSIVEALALRTAGVTTPILVLGYTLPERIREATENDITLTISQFESLKFLQKAKIRDLKIHIKIDTGMHRQGFESNQVSRVIQILKKLSQIKVEGIYTHFAAAKNPAFPADTRAQADEFNKALQAFALHGYNNLIKHASATSGTIIFPEYHFDMVRVGIGLYGLWPSKETRHAFQDKLKLKPVLSWKTIISEIKSLPKGSRLGYDFTETVDRDSIIAICPIGYWHGYPRSLSSIGRVSINGKQAKIIGRISMDMIIVDITDIKNTKVGDVVTLLGDDISADQLAYLADTTAYEIVTRINPLIKRIYL